MSSFKWSNMGGYIRNVINPYIINILEILRGELVFRPELCYGSIIPYYGELDQEKIHPYRNGKIYTNWWLCNGLNNTPDLTNKFVRGIDSGVTAGASGGEDTHIHNVSISTSGSVGNTKLTESQMPSHTHRMEDRHTGIHNYSGGDKWSGAGHIPVVSSVRSSEVQISTTYEYTFGDLTYHNTQSSGMGAAHSHSLNVYSSGSINGVSNIPEYIGLYYIMYNKNISS